MEIVCRGRDYDSATVSISDMNRPGPAAGGLFTIYFRPKRLQMFGKSEMMPSSRPWSWKNAAGCSTTCCAARYRPSSSPGTWRSSRADGDGPEARPHPAAFRS